MSWRARAHKRIQAKLRLRRLRLRLPVLLRLESCSDEKALRLRLELQNLCCGAAARTVYTHKRLCIIYREAFINVDC